MTDKIVFFGHHKCASRFFRFNVMSSFADANGYTTLRYNISKEFHFIKLHELDLFNIDFDLFASQGKFLLNLCNASVAVYEKVLTSGGRFRGVRIIRDPRQILVSSYFHHREGHNTIGAQGWVWDKLVEDRPVLQRLNLENGILYELNNITKDLFENQIFQFPQDEKVLVFRLEEFNRNFNENIQKIGNFLECPNIPQVKPVNLSFNPKSEHWSNVFTPKVKTVFKHRYGDQLIALGYEKTNDW